MILSQGEMMSKLVLIFGVLFLAAGVALGLLIHFQPGQMQVLALTPEVAAILLVGGALCLGIGNIAGALRERGVGSVVAVVEKEEPAVELSGSTPATPKFKGFGAKAVAAAVEASDAEASAAMKTSVADTISALEQAKTDIAIALGVEPTMTEVPAAKTEVAKLEVPVAVAEAEAAPADGELYVVEEKVIRGRPARILSDGTVEAETDEGWMRFENLEHLDEYLEAAASDT